MKSLGLAAGVLLCLSLLAVSALAEVHSRSLGPGQGILDGSGRDNPCGFPRVKGTGFYDNAYAWDIWMNQDPPYYTSFAEYFTGESPEVCGVILDMTKPGAYPPVLIDVMIWDNASGDVPGNVLSITTNVDPGPIATWPNITRVTVPLDYPAYPTGAWWAGFCLVGRYQYDYPTYYIASDQTTQPAQGRPYTNIPPGWGYPDGWNPVEAIWGYTSNLGIGILAHTMQPAATPMPAGATGSWGRIKNLYK